MLCQKVIAFIVISCCISCARSEDFYQLLGVGRRATPGDIKKAYRSKSLEFHPDKNKDNGAAEKFARINRAYEVLSDDSLRDIYNHSGERGVDEYEQQASRNGGNEEEYDRYHRQYKMRATPRTKDVTFEYGVPLIEMYTGSSTKVDMVHQALCRDWEMCIKVDKGCAQEGVRIRIQQVGPGFTQRFQLQDNDCVAPGKLWVRGCRYCPDGRTYRKTESIVIDVPKGARNNHKLRFPGMADEKPYHDAGDVVISLKEEPDDKFRRVRDDLHLTLNIPLVDALTNFTTSLSTVDGRTFDFTADGVITTGDSRRIPGRGMPRTSGHGFGEMIVEFEIDFPTDLSLRQKQLVREALSPCEESHDEL